MSCTAAHWRPQDFENRDPLKGDGNMETGTRAMAVTLTLKTETRLKGMETVPGRSGPRMLSTGFENRDPLKGDGNVYHRQRTVD